MTDKYLEALDLLRKAHSTLGYCTALDGSPAELYEKIGGFDEAYAGGYWEDVDLNERVKAAGFKVWYEPRTSLIHKVGTSGGSPNFARNAALFRERWVVPRKIQADVNATLERWW